MNNATLPPADIATHVKIAALRQPRRSWRPWSEWAPKQGQGAPSPFSRSRAIRSRPAIDARRKEINASSSRLRPAPGGLFFLWGADCPEAAFPGFHALNS
jgi:hypothetical protein